MNGPMISASLLSADFCNMERDIKIVESAGVDWLHCDVMDGMFVPNITFGQKMIKDIKRCARLPLDVHLMIEEPERYIEEFIASGADIVTFHIEATDKPELCIDLIKKHGIKAGISIKPNTGCEAIYKLIHRLDLVLIMSVEPGFGGQAFIEKSLEKIKAIKPKLTSSQILQVDGGINVETAARAVEAGANNLVAGNSLFSAADKAGRVSALKGNT